jgi:hypothetical protein
MFSSHFGVLFGDEKGFTSQSLGLEIHPIKTSLIISSGRDND